MLFCVLFVIIYSYILCNRTHGEGEEEGEDYGKVTGGQ